MAQTIGSTQEAGALPARSSHADACRRWLRADLVVGIAVGVVAVHVLADAFFLPEPGTSAADHLVAAFVPLVLLAAVVCLYPRLRAGARGTIAVALGLLALAGAGPAVAHTREVGPTGDDWTGVLLLPAGIALCAVGAATLWRSRKPHGRRHLRRALLAGAAALGAFWLVLPVAIAIVATHRPREAVRPLDLGRPYETVTVRTRDGLEIDGRYVPSRNGAAVIVFPASTSRAPQARMLVRHGYGVLMLEMRGYGSSEGDPNAFGWGATKDIDAAVAFLQARPDVERGRIGGLGFSVGGEQMLEAAADNPGLRAVVSEGAGERSVRETLIRGLPAALVLPMRAVQTAAVALLSGEAPPPALDDLLPRIAPRAVFLVHAERGVGGEDLQPRYFEAARQPKRIWKIADATHTGGFAARPAEYERRVTAFLAEALGR
jgi:hypothetical protein